ncbi:hypothetical protein [Spiroplasma endosymbiont of Nomada rufipes]|uniref:hypothetical protein n=1 Tax=Spiroplasma endosymbiont of Nomada rufipes TaxID=3077933 RepID=UPI00376EE369
MENKNNIDWNVNLNYITKDDLKTIYGFIPDADQTTIDNTKTDFTIMSIAISSERINTITGNQIEVIGFKNLNETQQTLVKRATARMTIYYLTDGMAFIISSVSISGNGLSSSISPPSEPDYVLMEVYNLLQQANLHTPRKAINNPISCNTDNFNTPSIFDESDRRVITWDSGNKTFLQKIGLIAGTGIKIDDVSDTIPKLKIHVDSNIDSLWQINKDNPNFINSKDDKGIDVNGKRIIDVGTPTFLSDATTKEYVDKKQDKLTAGENIKIDENNKISATCGKTDLTDYYKKEEVDKKLHNKMDKDQFKYVFSINTIGTEIPNLETTDKTVAGAINEINKKQSSQNIPQWKKVADVFCSDNKDWITYNCLPDTKYKIWYNISPTNCTPSSEHTFMSQEFVYSYNGKVPAVVVIASLDNKLLKLEKGNHDKFGWDNNSYGNLWKLEELQE